MKRVQMKLLLGGFFMLTSSLALADAFEVVSLKFKEGVRLEEQKSLMAELNQVITNYEGFKSRDYFYSPENGRWIDFVVWSDVKLAKRAAEAAMNDPKVGVVFSKMDEKTMIFSHYERMGGAKK
jgi:hypothetical protein